MGKNKPENRQVESEILRHFEPRIKRLIAAKIGYQNPAVEDLTQEVLLGVLLALRRDNIEPGKMPSYIFSVAWNKIKTYWKRKKRDKNKKVPLDDAELIEQATQHLKLVEEERKKHLRRELQNLPDKCREILKLRYLEERDIEQLSQLFGLESDQKVYDRLSYCLKQLRDRASLSVN